MSSALSLLSEANRLLETGDLPRARERCKEAVAAFQAAAPADSIQAAQFFHSAGVVLETTGAYAEAEACAAQASAQIEALPPGQELLHLQIMGLLGNSLRQQGEYEKAEGPLLRAIEIAESMPTHPQEILLAWNNFGILCKYAGWFERGERAYARALEVAERLGENREAMTATILHNLGGLHHARGRFDLAEEPSRRAWKMRRRLLGANHPTTLADATAYAAVLDRLGRYGESLPIYELALDFYERTFGPEHYETAATLHNLALVERAAGHHARAEKLARRALDIKTKLLGATHPDTALSALNLAAMLIPSQPEAAELLLQGALAVLTRALAPDHPHVIRCRQLLEGLRNADHHPKREALR